MALEKAKVPSEPTKQVRQVGRAVAGEGIDVVTADPALQLREARGDLGRLAPAQRAQGGGQRGGHAAGIGRLGEAAGGAVGQDRLDRPHIVAHGAVADRARAAAVVARHAAERRPVGGRDVDREEQAVGLQKAVQAVEHQAGLDRDPPGRRIEVADLGQMLRDIDHDRRANRLAALGGAAAPGQNRHALLGGDLNGRRDISQSARHHHADRLNLVDRGIGGVAAPAEAVEQHLALKRALEPPGEPRVADLALVRHLPSFGARYHFACRIQTSDVAEEESGHNPLIMKQTLETLTS